MSSQRLQIVPRSNPACESSVDIGNSVELGTVAIQTQGCKLNQADSISLARQFEQSGYRLVDGAANADIIVVNTCTVTATADSKARHALRSARRANPEAVVVAAGCYPERAAAELRRMPEVSLVVGNREKPHLAEMAIAELGQRSGSKPTRRDGKAVSSQGGILRRSRAMVKIQEGCDQVCAYCIVPKVRGRERSVPADALIHSINQHVANGYKEVTLTGTQLGTYGFDLREVSLTSLIARVLSETDLPRLRVSSLQAHEITPELLALWDDPRLCPHFHVPLQSGCDATLRTMRRRYDTATFRSAVELIRRRVPDAGVTTDVIVGFPGEDEAAFEASLAFAGEIGFSDMHVFPYSQRPGTTAHYLSGQVSAEEKSRRVSAMMSIGADGFDAHRRVLVGQSRPVLWETARVVNDAGKMRWSGLTDNYVRVVADTTADLGNRITRARLLSLDGKSMVAAVES